MRPYFEIFRSSWKSWEALLSEVAEFASALGPGQLIAISHSEDRNEGVVVVWFWDEPNPLALHSGAVRFRAFRSSFKSWSSLLTDATEFAASLGRERVIGICHSADNTEGVVVVWYWHGAMDDG
jgi:hypothetical protein